MKPSTEWLLVEILTGLQKLACLSLDRTPAAELLTATARVWHEAITDGRAFDEQRDAPRIRQAFRTLANTREQWPAPKHLIDALPKIEQGAIGYEVKPASPEEAARRMAEIRATLDLGDHIVKPVDGKSAAAGADA